MNEPITRHMVKQVRCPKCDADPGAQCRKKRRNVSHVERLYAAQDEWHSHNPAYDRRVSPLPALKPSSR